MERLNHLQEHKASAGQRVQRVLGRIFSSIDPVIQSENYWMNGYWETEQTHQSGRVSRINSLRGAIFVPTAEFINPYSDLSEEEKALMVEQFEAPPTPGKVDRSP